VIGSDLIAGILHLPGVLRRGAGRAAPVGPARLGESLADNTVTLIAFCPTAFFFSAVYTEGLYLLLSVGCILLARRGRWLWAGVLGGLAAASRNSGVVLLVPFLLLFLYGPRRICPSRRRAGRRRDTEAGAVCCPGTVCVPRSSWGF